MKSSVVIKGNKYGFVIALNPDIGFDELLAAVKDKFRASGAFFDLGRPAAVSFTGRDLSPEEQNTLIDAIEDNSPLVISCLVGGAGNEEDRFLKAFDKAGYLDPDRLGPAQADPSQYSKPSAPVGAQEITEPPQEETGTPLFQETDQIDPVAGESEGPVFPEDEVGKKGQFYRGILRSGQKIEVDGSFVILGDVNPGAQIIAGGNVVVLGTLKGTVYAGFPADRDAIVAALTMDPMQIQIGNLIARSADQESRGRGRLGKRKKQLEMEPRMAFVDGDNICIEKIDRSLINEISNR